MEPKVRIYLDLNNILCGARQAAACRGEDPRTVRVHARRLSDLLAAGRPVADAHMVLNQAMPEAIRRYFGQHLATIEVESGVISGRDQGADEKLQLQIHNDLDDAQEPGVIVLATGDGAGWSEGRGFTRPLRRARQLGHGVEVVSFSSALHPQLRRLASMPGNALVELDNHYRSITFEQGGVRFPDPISLRHRPTATPHPWSVGELDWLANPVSGDRTPHGSPAAANGGAA